MKATMFTFGMVMLELCSLLPPAELYTDNEMNEKNLKKRL